MENEEIKTEGVTPEAETKEEIPEKEEKKTRKKSKDEELHKEIEELKARLAEAEDKHLRMAAEYDNFRRRSREEREAVYETALADTVSELLPILDNLERAAMYDDGEKVKEGLVLTLKTVDGVLAKLGVEKYAEAGDTFDPNIHNAVLHVDDENLGEGEITDVFQKGYKKGKKIIRFAMVKSAN